MALKTQSWVVSVCEYVCVCLSLAGEAHLENMVMLVKEGLQ